MVLYAWVCECVCALTQGATASHTCSVTVEYAGVLDETFGLCSCSELISYIFV